MANPIQPTRFALEGAITIDAAARVNTLGAFCDLYTGTHPIAGKVAMKMPRDSSYSGATMKVIEIAEGLVYLHQFEPAIVHGDVKGNNVLVASDHHARLCDFGLARHIDARTATALKGAGSTPWQSPETLKGDLKSLQSDVYAFGITIYEVLSGKVPYSDLHIASIITGILFSGLRPPLEPLSAPDGTSYLRFWSEATRCWSDSPADRPSMTDVLRNLRLSPSTTPMPHHLEVVPIPSSTATPLAATTLQHPGPINTAIMAGATESTPRNAFQDMQLLISLSPIPGIAAIAILAQECYRRGERVKIRKSEVRELCKYGANVVMIINEHAQKVPQSSLDQSINALKITLTDISKAIDLWANYGRALLFLKNDEILAGIRKYRSDLTSLQQKLNQEYWDQLFEAAGEADRAELAKTTDDIAALTQKMDQMQQYFANYRPYSREDPDGSQLSKVREELFALRDENKDEPVVPKGEIEGEVQKIGSRPERDGLMF